MGGVNATGGVLAYQFGAGALGRVTLDSDDNAGPYTTEFTAGDPVVGSAATYDQVASLLKLVGGRHVDPFGNVVNAKKVWLITWYWLLDGCPMPLPRTRLDFYMAKANVLRPWPATVVAAFAAEGYTLPTSEGAAQDYSTVNPDATLDSLT